MVILLLTTKECGKRRGCRRREEKTQRDNGKGGARLAQRSKVAGLEPKSTSERLAMITQPGSIIPSCRRGGVMSETSSCGEKDKVGGNLARARSREDY